MIRCKYVFKKVVCVAPAGYSMQLNLEHHHLWYFNVVFISEKEYGCKKKTGCFCLRRGDVHGGSWLSQERDRYSISQSSRSKVDCAMVLKWSIGRVLQCTGPPTSMRWHSLLCRVNYCLPYQTILARPLSILQIRSDLSRVKTCIPLFLIHEEHHMVMFYIK